MQEDKDGGGDVGGRGDLAVGVDGGGDGFGQGGGL